MKLLDIKIERKYTLVLDSFATPLYILIYLKNTNCKRTNCKVCRFLICLDLHRFNRNLITELPKMSENVGASTSGSNGSKIDTDTLDEGIAVFKKTIQDYTSHHSTTLPKIAMSRKINGNINVRTKNTYSPLTIGKCMKSGNVFEK